MGFTPIFELHLQSTEANSWHVLGSLILPLGFRKCFGGSQFNENLENIRGMSLKWANSNASVFVRVTTCRIFLVAKLRYAFRILYGGRLQVQGFSRLFASFVWTSGSESMRRDNLFRWVKFGELGVTHLFPSLIVSRPIFLCDQERPFVRTVLQTKLFRAIPDFLVSSYEVKTGRGFGILVGDVDSFLFRVASFH